MLAADDFQESFCIRTGKELIAKNTTLDERVQMRSIGQEASFRIGYPILYLSFCCQKMTDDGRRSGPRGDFLMVMIDTYKIGYKKGRMGEECTLKCLNKGLANLELNGEFETDSILIFSQSCNNSDLSAAPFFLN